MLRDGTIATYAGKSLAMPVRSILVHGDTPGAVALTRTIRAEIEAAGGRIVPISQQMERTTNQPRGLAPT